MIDEKGLAQRDHFDLINADNQYMDDELDRGAGAGIDAFFAEVSAMRDGGGEGEAKAK